MAGRHPFEKLRAELFAKMTPERRAAYDAEAQRLHEEMNRAEAQQRLNQTKQED